MTTNIMGYAILVLGYALTFLFIVFGIWIYRKIELRSLPWALAYLILGIVSSIIFYGLIRPQFASSQHTAPAQFATYLNLNATWAYANQLLLAMLVLADCAVLIIKAGGKLTGKFAEFWRWIYDKSTIIGCVFIASILVRIIWGLLLWRSL